MGVFYLMDENEKIYSIDECPTNEQFRNRWHQVELVNDYRVSTVFLIIDHNHWDGRPILFETMVFDSEDNGIY